MHDLTYFRSHFERIAERLAARGGAINLEGFRDLDQKRRSAISTAEQLKARKNQESVEIGKLRSEEHTSELQSLRQLVCRLLLEKKPDGGSLERHFLDNHPRPHLDPHPRFP